MAIHDPGGTIIWRSLDASSKPLFINALGDALRDAGWTDGSVSAYVVLTFTGLPSDTQTCAFDGRTYTFVTTLTAADQVKIGATAAECASNLFDAITDNSGNEGVTYGTGTTIHATLGATVAGAQTTIYYLTAGTGGNGFAASESLSNATLDVTAGRYGGRKLTSARTPDGLWYKVYLFDDNSFGNPYIQFSDVWEQVSSPLFRIQMIAARLVNVRACRYEFETLELGVGAAGNGGTAIQSLVPFLRDGHKPYVVANAQDDGGGLVKITTNVAHGRATNDFVFIADATIGGVWSSNINGSRQITVIDSTNYTLQGSSWPGGTYDADSGRHAGPKQIARLIFAQGDNYGTQYHSFRSGLSSGAAPLWVSFNQFAWDTIPVGTASAKLMHPAAMSIGPSVVIPNWGGFYDVHEPVLTIPPTAASADRKIVGEMWASFVADHTEPLDATKAAVDGVHDVFQYTADGVFSWWLWTS